MKPDPWQVDRLGDLCERITDGSHSSPKPVEDGLPIVTVANMRTDGIDLTNCVRIAPKDFATLEQYGCRPEAGDVLFSKDGSVGKVLVMRGGPEFVVLSSIAILTPKQDRLSSNFLAHSLKWSRNLRVLHGMKTGTAIKRVVLRDLRRLRLVVPPLFEQCEIAAILSSVDETIEKTQAVIDQMQVVKRGLMQELLTRGLSNRHPKSRHSKTGAVSRQWESVRLGEIFRLASGKSIAVRSLDEVASDANPYPVFGGNGVAGFTSSPSAQPPLLVIGRVGEYCGTVHQPLAPCWVSDNALYTRTWLRPVNVGFLAGLLQFVDLTRLRKRSGQPLVTQAPIHDLEVSLPSVPEQDEIAELLDQLDVRRTAEERTRDGLRHVRSALMSVLLTGELRVTPDLEPE